MLSLFFLCSISLRVAVESREKKLWGNYELQFLRYLNLQVNRTGSNERNKLIFIRTHFLLSNHFISDYSFFSSLFFFSLQFHFSIWLFCRKCSCMWAWARVHSSHKIVPLYLLDAHQPVKPPLLHWLHFSPWCWKCGALYFVLLHSTTYVFVTLHFYNTISAFIYNHFNS